VEFLEAEGGTRKSAIWRMRSTSASLTERLSGSEPRPSEDESEQTMGLVEEFPFRRDGELRWRWLEADEELLLAEK
jgi:hypothetical protein